MIYSQRKNYLLPAILMSLLLLVLLLNAIFTLQLNIKSFSEIYPKEKWILTWGTNGQIISNMIDYSSGHTVAYNLNQFERGEFISLKFNPLDKTGKIINKGDTIISMSSSEVEERLTTAEGELEVAKANLQSKNTGEKESVIEEAKNRLGYTIEKINQQQVLFNRDSVLYEKGLISEQESQIKDLSTGVKTEEVDLLKSQIKSIESRLNVLNKRKNNLTIVSPITGYISDTFSPDTLLVLINDRETIIRIPIKIEDIDLLKNRKTVKIGFADSDTEYKGSIISISREVKFIDNQQVVFVSILIKNTDGRLMSGMVKETYIKLNEISLFKYLSRIVSS
jgi:hypothetical protein